jgi:hypothetical protein
LVDATVGQVVEFVAQRAHARGRQFGLLELFGKVVARMGLEGQHAAWHPALLRLAAQQRQHGLVPAVYTIKVADGQGTGGSHTRMVKTAENFHEFVIFLIAGRARLINL